MNKSAVGFAPLAEKSCSKHDPDCMGTVQTNVLGLVLSQITPGMTPSERASVLVESLRNSGVNLRTQPSLEEVKRLLIRVLRAGKAAMKCDTPLAL
jgi:hypothetical protein